MILAIDILLSVLSPAFFLWAINYSILAQVTEDKNEARGNFLISFGCLCLAVSCLLIVMADHGGI